MISYELFCRLRQLHDQKHLNSAQIARELNLHEATVRKWIAQTTYLPRLVVKRSSKLDSFKGTIVRLLEQHAYTGSQLFQRLKEEGYTGGPTILRDFLTLVRPKTTRAFLSLQFAPGQAAQVDWGSAGTIRVGSVARRLSFFVMVLCFSRRMYLEFTLRESQEHFLQCHQNAFEYFGGAPTELIVDNCKVAVTRHSRGEAPIFNGRYLDFARNHGCQLRACNPHSPHEKGRVEKAVDYVKHNFLAGLELSSPEALNAAAKLWLSTVANVRLHRETGKTPDELFLQEKPQLRPLPTERYDVATVQSVRIYRSFRFPLDGNKYSVPAMYAGSNLTLKVYPHCLVVLDGQRIVAEHLRSYDRRQDLEHPDHPKPLLENRFRANQQRNLMRFLQLGPMAEAYYQQLAERQLNALQHVARILALSQIHGLEATARALADAFDYQAFGADYIANLLQQRQRVSSEPGPLHLTRASDLLQLELPSPDLSIY